jgi:drug/metabolite transporter (DMT)-like permease
MTYLHDLQGRVPGTIALQYFYIGQCLFNSVAMMFESVDLKAKSLDLNFYFYLFGLTITAYLTQNFMTRAIMLKKPSFIMPLGYITIILSTIMDFFLFGNSFSMLSIVGMLLTSSGLLVKLLIP